MYAEASSRNGAEGVLDVGSPACAPLISVKLDARDGAEGGGFDVRPLACILNSSSSQTRFKESISMS
jgi:hypothetical protein